jgi:hypothetical protein
MHLVLNRKELGAQSVEKNTNILALVIGGNYNDDFHARTPEMMHAGDLDEVRLANSVRSNPRHKVTLAAAKNWGCRVI